MNTWTLFIQQASILPPAKTTIRTCAWHLCTRTFEPTPNNMKKIFCSPICRRQAEQEFKKGMKQ